MIDFARPLLCNMLPSILFSLAAIATGVSARRCRDIVVPVSLTSRNAVFDLEPLTTEVDVTNFYLNLAKQGRNYTKELLTGVGVLPSLSYLHVTNSPLYVSMPPWKETTSLQRRTASPTTAPVPSSRS